MKSDRVPKGLKCVDCVRGNRCNGGKVQFTLYLLPEARGFSRYRSASDRCDWPLPFTVWDIIGTNCMLLLRHPKQSIISKRAALAPSKNRQQIT